MRRIRIFDTTLRDGEQCPGASLNVDEKLVIARQLERLGVDVIEAGFPITSPGDFESVRLIAENVRKPTICGLARAVPGDIERAAEALRPAERGRIHIFIATSRLHMDKKLRKSPEEVLEMARRGVELGRNFTDDIEFSPEDASRTDLDFMCRVIEAAVRAGATTINIPDTVGYAIPGEIAERVRHVRNRVPGIEDVCLSIHCHDDLGLAVANSLAAVEAGCDQIECTINGLGERAGNTSLEEVVMALTLRQTDYRCETGIDTTELWSTSRLVSNLTGIEVQRNKAIVGRNAFAHESGIHQHGVISDRRTYEIMAPEDVGWRGDQLVIGKHSGVHAIEAVLKSRGYSLTREQLREVSERVKEAADKHKNVQEEDIVAFAGEVLDEQSADEVLLELREVSVMTGNHFTASAVIKLSIEGKEALETGTGVGPVDAASCALKNLLEKHVDERLQLSEYGLKAITGGTDALAHAHIQFRDEHGQAFRGEAIHSDVILASVEAMVKGANRALNIRRRLAQMNGGTGSPSASGVPSNHTSSRPSAPQAS